MLIGWILATIDVRNLCRSEGLDPDVGAMPIASIEDVKVLARRTHDEDACRLGLMFHALSPTDPARETLPRRVLRGSVSCRSEE